MAARAVGSELAVVDIIRFVAIGAVATLLNLRCQWLPVAGFASDALMGSIELESGLCVVIKKCLLPVHRRVAKHASFAEPATMGVVFLVAGNALLRRVSEHVRVMALAALLFVVFAEQRKTGQAMVEEDIVLPGAFVMAVRTRYSQRRVMGVVVFVARQAVGRERRLEYRLDVACSTFGFGMSPVEGVSGVCRMIELHFGPSGARVT